MRGRVVVFTKPPEPGRVKTRLIPALGPEGAARLHAAFVQDTLALCAQAGLELTLALAGDPDGAWARGLGVRVVPQVPGDLGARMAAALDPGPAFALGTDAPTLPLALLEQAATLDADLVLGPAFDGGYWAVGWREARPEVFAGVPWSTEAVLAETLLRARAAVLSERLTPYWYDVDTPEALAFLRQHLRVLPDSVAPATRAALADLGRAADLPRT
ncbi:MAG: TIGR04282 family arsenosugar biosynthesis glycosyltransferase [Alphaproteobacteria bacterium]|nr:TIGR04282 family arsenosugar biosynthesis glycosyltransferase [Alphaproteobacteria bacterium]